MDQRTDGPTAELMDRQTDGHMDQRTDGRTNSHIKMQGRLLKIDERAKMGDNF